MDEQHTRWSADMPDAYDRLLAPAIFEPYARDLAHRVAASSPARLVEIAAGTGIVTRALLDVPGVVDVVATDLNPAMVELGRQRVPRASWEVADALTLPFEDCEFDAVVCQFGVMFFPDKVAGMAQARRVLADGGTFHANSWGALETHGIEVAYLRALKAVLNEEPPDFLATVPHGYADPDRLASDARAAGFTSVRVDIVTLTNAAMTPRDAAVGYTTGTPMRAGLEAKGDLAALADAIAGEMERLLGADPVELPMTANVLTAAVQRA
ncbi:MAG TPA: methyltransferase domain-containing protein [Mycobacteriales bacterium]|jgi:ubiquinone/menaquinone biosynthesis C-methylase UbiE|nr:methyltransferase domain-containing protein [Mycobacteriales bacterium]